MKINLSLININLTTKIYIDPGKLDVRPSVNKLPNLLDSRKDSRKLFTEGAFRELRCHRRKR